MPPPLQLSPFWQAFLHHYLKGEGMSGITEEKVPACQISHDVVETYNEIKELDKADVDVSEYYQVLDKACNSVYDFIRHHALLGIPTPLLIQIGRIQAKGQAWIDKAIPLLLQFSDNAIIDLTADPLWQYSDLCDVFKKMGIDIKDKRVSELKEIIKNKFKQLRVKLFACKLEIYESAIKKLDLKLPESFPSMAHGKCFFSFLHCLDDLRQATSRHAIIKTINNIVKRGSRNSSENKYIPLLKQLKERLRSPYTANQGTYNVCGPAVVLMWLAELDPVGYTKMFLDLIMQGESEFPFAAKSIEGAANIDELMMLSLRNKGVLFYDTMRKNATVEPLLSVTKPQEIVDWFEHAWGDEPGFSVVNTIQIHTRKHEPASLLRRTFFRIKQDDDAKYADLTSNFLAVYEHAQRGACIILLRDSGLARGPVHALGFEVGHFYKVNDMVWNEEKDQVRMTVEAWGRSDVLVLSWKEFIATYRGAIVFYPPDRLKENRGINYHKEICQVEQLGSAPHFEVAEIKPASAYVSASLV